MMTKQHRTTAGPDTRHGSAFRIVKALIGTYLGVSIATIVAVVLLRNDTAIVNDAVWVRSIIVLASALFTLSFAVRAERGSRRNFLRLRLVSAIMTIAIAVIIALPGTFPTWLKIEQGFCGLLLLGVVVLVNGKALRSAFAAK
jgi:hypothetical protein